MLEFIINYRGVVRVFTYSFIFHAGFLIEIREFTYNIIFYLYVDNQGKAVGHSENGIKYFVCNATSGIELQKMFSVII